MPFQLAAHSAHWREAGTASIMPIRSVIFQEEEEEKCSGSLDNFDDREEENRQGTHIESVCCLPIDMTKPATHAFRTNFFQSQQNTKNLL